MPRDGSSPEMSLEERALRYADAFFTDESRWYQGGFQGPNGRICVLGAFCRFGGKCGKDAGEMVITARQALNERSPGFWNDNTCPNFAALKAKLQERIEYYQNQRLKDSYIVGIGPGRQVEG